MTTRPANRPGRTRNSGVLIAVGLGLCFAGVIVWFVLRAPADDADGSLGAGSVPNIRDILERGEGEAARGMFVQVADKDDPTRLAAEILASRVEPRGVSEREVNEPRGWIFMRDGRALHFEADDGRFYIPPRQSWPESGTLRGNVRIRVYEDADGQARPDLDTEAPALTVTTDRPLEFDMRHARISTPGRVVATTPNLEFAGRYLTAVLNEVRERLELLEVAEGEYIRYTPDAPEPTGTSARPAPPSPAVTPVALVRERRPAQAAEPTNTPTAPPGDPREPKIDLYRAVFLDGVRITQGERELDGDKLDAWVRLINNAIPDRSEDADPPAADPGEPARERSGAPRAAEPGAAAPRQEAEPAEADDPLPVLLTWTGPLQVTPISGDAPDVLRDDDVYLRVTAERTGLVTGRDRAGGLTGSAVAVEGGLTSRRVLLSGPGGNVELEAAGVGRFVGSRATGSLERGEVTVIGPGVMDLEASEAEGRGAGRLAWREQADLEFEPGSDGGIGDLRRARFLGTVDGAYEGTSVRGAYVDSAFVPGRDGAARISVVSIERGTLADGEGGSLAGDAIRIDFAEGTHGEDADPRRVVARGNVRAVTREARLTGERLDAGLSRDEEGAIIVTEAVAEEDVRYAGTDGTTATGDRIEVDGLQERVRLSGREASFGRDGVTVFGERIDLDAPARQAVVRGAGRFVHTPASADAAFGHVEAAWTEFMTFDDRAGDLECVGDAVVVSRPDPLTRETVEASRLRLVLTPYDEDAEGSAARSAEDRVQLAFAYGSENGRTPAKLESRRYTTPGHERVEQVLYLDGAEIIADNRAQTLEVPTSGRLVVLDRTPEQDGERRTGAAAELGGPGRALFEWDGSLALDRASGTVEMLRHVRALHRRAADGMATELECERLVAIVRETSEVAGASLDGARGELVSAEATGAVYLRSGHREMIADEMQYDAAGGTVFAEAAEGNRISVFDATGGAGPVYARTVWWDLVRDRIEVDRPSPAIGPR